MPYQSDFRKKKIMGSKWPKLALKFSYSYESMLLDSQEKD